MLRLLGTPRILCDGRTWRDFLHLGGLSALGLGLSEALRLRETQAGGGEVRDLPVSPKDILATAFHLLGIDPRTTITDPLGRPTPIAGSGEVRAELLS